MARKKISPEERRRIEKAREIKKAKNCKPGPDDKDEVKKLKGDDLCAICDEGGVLVCCDGGCQRSFHLNQPKCRSMLGLAEEQAKMITDDKDKVFICNNCKYKQHQCFSCGKLGSSELSSAAEVFRCGHDNCAHFYHPKCVAKLLYPDSEMEAPRLELQIAAGQGFKCPAHECSVCKGGEDKDDKNQLQFAICRRCPTTYHRKCLPCDILPEEGPNGEMQRAWDKLVEPDGHVIHLDQMLIYCTKHGIIEKLGTPELNHIVFPKDTPEEEEVPDHPLPELYQPPLAARDQHQCSCSIPLDSFAPSSLFPHPHPGSGGWLED